jgi:hypothetical protein
VRRAIAQAFQRWSAICNFNFRPTEAASCDIAIEFGDLGQSANTEKGNALAVCSGTGRLARKTIVFGDQYRWASIEQNNQGIAVNLVLWIAKKLVENGDKDTYDLVTTAVHEIGHALGLGHNPDKSSVMQESVGDWNDTWTYYMSRHPLPDIDAQSLWERYKEDFPNPPVPSSRGYAVVGSSYSISNLNSTSFFKDVEEFCWGDRANYPLQMMAGYAYNPFLHQQGYGQLLVHLVETEEAAGRRCVVGGGVLFPPSASMISSDGTGYTATYQWGSQQGDRQIAARTKGWHPTFQTDTEALMYFVLSDSEPPAMIKAFATQIGSAGSNPNTLYWARKWGTLDPSPKPGEQPICSVGRTWPVNKDKDPTYNGAYSATYIQL